MTQYRATRTLTDSIKLVFTWSGGTYIDVARYGYAPSEVINVWDYEKNESRVPFTKPAMRRAIDTWIEEYPREALVLDAEAHWT